MLTKLDKKVLTTPGGEGIQNRTMLTRLSENKKRRTRAIYRPNKAHTPELE